MEMSNQHQNTTMESEGLFFGCNGANGVVMYLKKTKGKGNTQDFLWLPRDRDMKMIMQACWSQISMGHTWGSNF